MISVPKSAAFSASVNLFNNTLQSVIPIASNKLVKVNIPRPTKEEVRVPKTALTASVGILGKSQIRCYHSDISVPSFDEVRRKDSLDPNNKNQGFETGRMFLYMVAGGGTFAAVHTGLKVVPGYLKILAPAKDVMAMAKVEVNLSQIPEGKSMVFKWRGKPLFIRHRTAEEIEKEQSVNLAELRDPQHDSERVPNPKWMIVLGICTHLGCVPVADAGDFGGYYCPCHGSHYDASGRIRKGPAPLNLEVPPYEFAEEDLVIVG